MQTIDEVVSRITDRLSCLDADDADDIHRLLEHVDEQRAIIDKLPKKEDRERIVELLVREEHKAMRAYENAEAEDRPDYLVWHSFWVLMADAAMCIAKRCRDIGLEDVPVILSGTDPLRQMSVEEAFDRGLVRFRKADA